MAEISTEQSSTLIVPVPMDLFRPYLQISDGSGDLHAQQPKQRSQAAPRSAEEKEIERLYEEAVGERPTEEEPL